jgi:hypothetical protein
LTKKTVHNLYCQALTTAAREEKALLPSIHEYEAQMLKDGFEAVRSSARAAVS